MCAGFALLPPTSTNAARKESRSLPHHLLGVINIYETPYMLKMRISPISLNPVMDEGISDSINAQAPRAVSRDEPRHFFVDRDPLSIRGGTLALTKEFVEIGIAKARDICVSRGGTIETEGHHIRTGRATVPHPDLQLPRGRPL